MVDYQEVLEPLDEIVEAGDENAGEVVELADARSLRSMMRAPDKSHVRPLIRTVALLLAHIQTGDAKAKGKPDDGKPDGDDDEKPEG